jgi:hypothetical protein
MRSYGSLREKTVPRESIQITGIQFETSSTGIVTVTIRTPDNSSFVVFESIDDTHSWYVGARTLVQMKREAQKKVTDARLGSSDV